MFKKTLFLAAVLAAVSSTFAQNLGVRAGLNLANQKLDIDGADLPDPDNHIGFHVGVVADIGITDMFYIQPGLLFSLKGTEYNMDFMGFAKVEAKMSLYYIEVPVLASAKIPINESLALRINAGPYVGFGIGGTGEVKQTVMGQSQTISGDAFGDDGTYNRLDFGVAFGGGIEFQKFYVGVNYGLGLANIAKADADEEEDTNAKAYNRCLGITLGYNF